MCPQKLRGGIKNPSSSGGGLERSAAGVSDAARAGEEALCGRHGGRLSEFTGERRDYTERRGGSTPGAFDSDNEGGAAAPPDGVTAPSSGVSWKNTKTLFKITAFDP